MPQSRTNEQSALANRMMRLKIQGNRYLNYLQEGGPSWGLMFASSRLMAARTFATSGNHAAPSAYDLSKTRLVGVDVDQVSATLDREGGAMGLRLSDEDAQAIRRFGEDCEVKRNWPNPEHTLLHLEQHYDLPLACPPIAALEKDPVLLEIAARYLQAPPVLIGTRMWWSLAKEAHAMEKAKHGQTYWHYDLHGYRTLKFNFYLTDVLPAGGGSAWLAGSHRYKRLRDQATLFIGRTHEEMMEIYGQEAVRSANGPMGTGYIFDPYAFHMGTPPVQDRLMLQIEYGLKRYLSNCYASAAPLPKLPN